MNIEHSQPASAGFAVSTATSVADTADTAHTTASAEQAGSAEHGQHTQHAGTADSVSAPAQASLAAGASRPTQPAAGLRLNIGCDATFETAAPTSMYFLVLPREGTHEPVEASLSFYPDTPYQRKLDSFGNQLLMLTAPAGTLRIRYDALVDLSRAADPVLPELGTTPVSELPGDVVQYLWPSRYCQSDLVIDQAWSLFGHVPDGWARVQAVCDWIHQNIEYGKGSTSATGSQDVLEHGRGVCRDFALLGVTFCRALNMPARYVCGYFPDVDVEPPEIAMDFHAWFEVYLDGEWRTFDARHNVPRIGRVLIAVGRDAADCAWSTSFGNARLTAFSVVADEILDTESA